MKQLHLSDPSLISVVVPIYNEEANVRPLMQRLRDVFERLQWPWEVVFALDPSPDRTRETILELVAEGWPIRLINFSRRIGKPLSLIAGLEHCTGDACVIIDADLQDPPELIEEMVRKWQEGFKVVIAQRTSRKGENLFYLAATRGFYRLLEWVSEVHVPPDTGDFRLLDVRVVKQICRFRERHGFLRGITAAAGFPTALIPFDRDPRFSGKTQISWLGSVNIALDGLIPFSRIPVRAIFWLGIIVLALAGLGWLAWLVLAVWAGFSRFWFIEPLCLWSTLLSGIIITCLGIIGEYVARTYEEAKDRPHYIVDEMVESETLLRKIAE